MLSKKNFSARTEATILIARTTETGVEKVFSKILEYPFGFFAEIVPSREFIHRRRLFRILSLFDVPNSSSILGYRLLTVKHQRPR